MNNFFINEISKFKKEIDVFIATDKSFLINLSKVCSGYADKYISILREYSKGGKRIRAYLVKLGYEMCSRDRSATTWCYNGRSK